MATQIIYLLNTTATAPNWFGRVQDNGSAPAGALSAFGWTTAKVATPAFWRGRLGASARSSVSQATSYIDAATGPVKGTGSAATTAGDSFCSDGPLNGTFAAGNWTFSFGMRTGAITHSGRVRCNMWASVNADGTSARELNTGTLVGSTITLNSTTATFTSSITWNAPAITLVNEYLFLQVEWETTTAGTSNSCSAQFYQCSFTTTNYVYAVVVNNLATGSPTIDAGVFAEVSPVVNLPNATALATSPPTSGAPTAAAISNFTATAIAVAPPIAIDQGILGQQHVLAPTNAAAGVRVFDTPTVVIDTGERALTAISLAVVAPLSIGVGTLGQEHKLTAVSLAVAPPIAIASGTLKQAHALQAVNATAGVPVIAAADISQKNVLTATSLVTVSPVLGQGGLVSGLLELKLGDYVLDNGLAAFAAADQMLLCSGQPSNYAGAQANKLGSKVLGAGNVFGAITFAADGRQITSAAIVEGTVNATGNAVCWVAIDTANSRLLASGLIDTVPIPLMNYTWAMDPVTLHLPRGF